MGSLSRAQAALARTSRTSSCRPSSAFRSSTITSLLRKAERYYPFWLTMRSTTEVGLTSTFFFSNRIFFFLIRIDLPVSCAARTARSVFHVAPSPRGSTGSCAESDAASFGDGRNQDRHSKRKAGLFLGRALSAFFFSSVFRLFFGRAL